MCESRPSPKESKAVFVTIRLIGLPFSFLFPSFDDAFALTLVLRLSSAYSCVITLCKPLSLTPFLLSLTRLTVWLTQTLDPLTICLWQIYLVYLGWLMGLAWVGEVQPGPVPTKPIPVRVRVQTHTVYLRVSSNTAGTRKPVQLFHYFLIFS